MKKTTQPTTIKMVININDLMPLPLPKCLSAMSLKTKRRTSK
jgi:hypothetical protein